MVATPQALRLLRIEGEFVSWSLTQTISTGGGNTARGMRASRNRAAIVDSANQAAIVDIDGNVELAAVTTLAGGFLDIAPIAQSITGRYTVVYVAEADIRVFDNGVLVQTIDESANLTSDLTAVGISHDGEFIFIFGDGGVSDVILVYQGNVA